MSLAKPFFLRFFHPYRWACIGALLALTLTAIITLSFGQGLRLLVDQGFSGQSLNHTGLIFLSLILLLGVGTFARFYWVNWLGERVVADIRQALFKHLLSVPIPFFEGQGTGELQSRIITDTSSIQQFISGSLSGVLRNLLILIGGIVFLFLENTMLTFIAFAMMPLVLLPLLLFGRNIKYLSNQNQEQVAKASGYLSETLGQIKTVQAFNYQDASNRFFSEKIQSVLTTAKKRIQHRGALISLTIVLVSSAVLLLLWLGSSWVLSGELSAGELAAFLFYAVLVASSLGTLSEFYGEWQQVKGALQRVQELLAISIPTQTEKSFQHSEKPLAIKIDKLSFSYPSRSAETLKELSLVINPGDSLGLVGLSGAGKSTLLELLLGFYPIKSGQVFLDEQDITNIPVDCLRDQIAWVSQQPAIFSGSVWENIAYSNPDASRESILAAAEAAHVTEFGEQLPEGYNTLVGEGGVRLSGGQCQRVALARAILKKPRLLLLDEPTSALDAVSEAYIQQALKAVMQNCTTIVIAHRLATVKALSRIAVMHEGKIVAVGTHEELLASSPLYAELAELQFIV